MTDKKQERRIRTTHHTAAYETTWEGNTLQLAESWSVAENRVWVPGVYATEADARRAPDLPDSLLQALQDAANAAEPLGVGGTITTAQLDAAFDQHAGSEQR